MNKLYFGDNLEVIREKISDKSADLIYLDHTMFQSNKNYNINKFSDGGYAYGK
jgi:site-specific DNA-methyltransferase (adenine-specific)